MSRFKPSEASLDDWLARIEALHPNEIEMGLERVHEVGERLGVLRPAPLTVIVAGTNGKGSTAVFSEALLLELGYRVGTTLSPHLERFNERVRIEGQACDDKTLCANFAAVDAARGEVPLTYFEFAALVALVSFRNAEVDVAILEVGLGGRLDAFNIVDADVAVVTSIGLDHQEYLGDDLEQIGFEKAGVFRHGQMVVLGCSITDSVQERARELGCRIARAGSEFCVQQTADNWSFCSDGLSLNTLPHGRLAAENCAMGLGVARWIEHHALRPATLTRDVVLGALDRSWMPGRFEVVYRDERRWVLDVAHNPAGAAFLCDQLSRHAQDPVLAIIGSLRDKDTSGIIAALRPVIGKPVICVGVEGDRGLGAAELAARLPPEMTHECSPDLATAMARARSLTRRDDVILACGSFAIVGRARSLLKAQ
ncbi:MAG: bifunctional tetrahydrofolate synthase/dihydrofolate synthase [Gammaproteobacteria bacterium]|nr:bifunctional tetrahydrofolate synthase/dihydrofolate synthase [Gammaproteobacteria bacterium]